MLANFLEKFLSDSRLYWVNFLNRLSERLTSLKVIQYDLREIYLNEKIKINYGICFYGVIENYFKGKNIIVQVKNLHQRIMGDFGYTEFQEIYKEIPLVKKVREVEAKVMKLWNCKKLQCGGEIKGFFLWINYSQSLWIDTSKKTKKKCHSFGFMNRWR